MGRFCTNQKLETVLRCHVMAFEACGGVPTSLEIAVARRSLAFYDIVAQRMAGVER